MSYLINITTTKCCQENNVEFIVDDVLSAITTGNTYLITSGETTDCYTVLDIKQIARPANATFSGDFTTCEICLSNITDVVVFISCLDRQVYFFDLSSFSILPTIGDTYYLEFIYRGVLVKGCFTTECYIKKKNDTTTSQLLSISDPYNDCPECSLNNLLVWAVKPCLTTTIETYYISLPPGTDYTNYIISFVDDYGELICGTVISQNEQPTTGNLISILGLDKEVNCQDCLVLNTEKRIITNCITGNDDVVWGSVFYEGNEITNLSTLDGCFEVGNLTQSAVTINTFLNYDPQPDCQECIQCNGVVYSFTSCTESGSIITITFGEGITSEYPDGTYGPFTGVTDGNGFGAEFTITIFEGSISDVSVTSSIWGYRTGDTITISQSDFGGTGDLIITIDTIKTTGGIFSYQYVENPQNKFVYIPYLNDCVQIDFASDDFFDVIMFSFDVHENCPLCNVLSTDYFIWKTKECVSESNFIVVVTGSTFIPGDIIKVKWGTTDFQCHEIISPYSYTDGNIPSYISNTTNIYEGCPSCNQDTLIGASIVKCGGGGQQFVNIPINIWNAMTYTDSQIVFVTQRYGQCYILLSDCPLDPKPTYPTIYPISTYYNCIECNFDNTRFPRSGGTEVFFCEEICTPSGSTTVSVSVPHPVWTDAYGTEVTQMGMVTLGGNGLNA